MGAATPRVPRREQRHRAYPEGSSGAARTLKGAAVARMPKKGAAPDNDHKLKKRRLASRCVRPGFALASRCSVSWSFGRPVGRSVGRPVGRSACRSVAFV